ncbi:response regulator [Clostridium sp. MSJ-11]|uniref:Response regulator n=1 Tax=Clostridium mobile TaxID=2841512 RepID=A0ABS6EJP8_9CLOT|nr:response regulator [Clostridium mobile]MBU5484675.1 response regulator [Clostridium mobile]
MKILIIDDSSFSQKVTNNLLKKYLQDFSVHFAGDGQEGYEKYKDLNPDYTFVDLLMPKVNGMELIKKIKKEDKNAKIVVISADVQVSVKEEAEQLGIMTFINKPFNDDKAKLVSQLIRNDINE